MGSDMTQLDCGKAQVAGHTSEVLVSHCPSTPSNTENWTDSNVLWSFSLFHFPTNADCLCAYRISVHHLSCKSPLNDVLVQREIHVTVQTSLPTLEGAKRDPLQQIIIYPGSWTNKSRVTHEPA